MHLWLKKKAQRQPSRPLFSPPLRVKTFPFPINKIDSTITTIYTRPSSEMLKFMSTKIIQHERI